MVKTMRLASSSTSEASNKAGKECVVGQFITEADGWKIVAAAKTWEGTPYDKKGADSIKGVHGDCSGITYKSYVEAGFPYPYQSTSTFNAYADRSHRFRQIDTTITPMQAGDVLFWPQHMAIYAPFPEGNGRRDTGVMLKGRKMANDMYTAFNAHNGKPYAPYNSKTFRPDKSPTVFRYLIIPGGEVCPP